MNQYPLPTTHESKLTRAAKAFMEENSISSDHLKSIELAMKSGQIGFDGSTRELGPVEVNSNQLVLCADADL